MIKIVDLDDTETTLKINNTVIMECAIAFANRKQFPLITLLPRELLLNFISRNSELLREFIVNQITKSDLSDIKAMLAYRPDIFTSDLSTSYTSFAEGTILFSAISDEPSRKGLIFIQDVLKLPQVNPNLGFRAISPLMKCAETGFFEAAKLLLAHKDINVGQTDEEGRNALHYACLRHTIESFYYRGFETFTFLCEQHPQLINHFCAPYFTTPLMVAAQFGEKKKIKHLLVSGADITITDSKGNTFLHYLMVRKNFWINERILLHPRIKEIVNIKNKMCETALSAVMKKIAKYALNPIQVWDDPDDWTGEYEVPYKADNIVELIKNGAYPYEKIVFANEEYDIYALLDLIDRRKSNSVKEQVAEMNKKITSALNNYIQSNIPTIVDMLLAEKEICIDSVKPYFGPQIKKAWLKYQNAIFKEFENRVEVKDLAATECLHDKKSRIHSFLNVKIFPFIAPPGKKLQVLEEKILARSIKNGEEELKTFKASLV